MSEAEMRSTAINLLLAGYDTTAKLMSVSLVVLEAFPELRRDLAPDRALIPDAIEEILRWAGVSQMIPRVVQREVEIARVTIRPGDVVYVLSAAGRAGRILRGSTSIASRSCILDLGTGRTRASVRGWPDWRPRRRCAGCWRWRPSTAFAISITCRRSSFAGPSEARSTTRWPPLPDQRASVS